MREKNWLFQCIDVANDIILRIFRLDPISQFPIKLIKSIAVTDHEHINYNDIKHFFVFSLLSIPCNINKIAAKFGYQSKLQMSNVLHAANLIICASMSHIWQIDLLFIENDDVMYRVTCNPKQWVGNLLFRKQSNLLINKLYNKEILHSCLVCNGRFFVVIVRNQITPDNIKHEIIYYDRKMLKWNVAGLGMSLPQGNYDSAFSFTSSCLLRTDTESKKLQELYLMASNEKEYGKCFKILLSESIDWKIERLLWIAFYKNENNESCLIQLLPKDILSCIC